MKKDQAIEVTILSGDDWKGIYVNGELKAENHSLNADNALAALDIAYESIYLESDYGWDCIGNCCPKTKSEFEELVKQYNLGVKRRMCGPKPPEPAKSDKITAHLSDILPLLTVGGVEQKACSIRGGLWINTLYCKWNVVAIEAYSLGGRFYVLPDANQAKTAYENALRGDESTLDGTPCGASFGEFGDVTMQPWFADFIGFKSEASDETAS